MSRSIALLGSTGSIGESTLQVIRHHPDRLHVEALAALGSKLDRLEQQVRELSPRLVAVQDPAKAVELKARIGDKTEVVSGDEGLLQVARLDGVDLVVAVVTRPLRSTAVDPRDSSWWPSTAYSSARHRCGGLCIRTDCKIRPR